MAWRTPMDPKIAALIGARIDVVGVAGDVIDTCAHREVVA
jgi:hypothetical protein